MELFRRVLVLVEADRRKGGRSLAANDTPPYRFAKGWGTRRGLRFGSGEGSSGREHTPLIRCADEWGTQNDEWPPVLGSLDVGAVVGDELPGAGLVDPCVTAYDGARTVGAVESGIVGELIACDRGIRSEGRDL